MVHCCFGVRHVLAFPTAIHNLRFRHCFRYLSSPPPTTTPNSRLPNHNRNNQGRYRGSQHSKRHSKNFEKVQDQSLALGLRTNNTRSPSTPTRFTNIMGHIHRRIKSTTWTLCLPVQALHQNKNQKSDSVLPSHGRHARPKENRHTEKVCRRRYRISLFARRRQPQTRSAHPRPCGESLQCLGQ